MHLCSRYVCVIDNLCVGSVFDRIGLRHNFDIKTFFWFSIEIRSYYVSLHLQMPKPETMYCSSSCRFVWSQWLRASASGGRGQHGNSQHCASRFCMHKFLIYAFEDGWYRWIRYFCRTYAFPWALYLDIFIIFSLLFWIPIDCRGLESQMSDICYAQTQYGFAALNAAAQEGHTECVRLLLDAGANKDGKATLVCT